MLVSNIDIFEPQVAALNKKYCNDTTIEVFNVTIDNTTNNYTELANYYCFTKTGSSTNLYSAFGAMILFVNALISYMMFNVDYATDDEWFRYLVFNFVSSSVLICFNLFQYLRFVKNLGLIDNYTADCMFNPYSSKCKIIFMVNTYSDVFNSVFITAINIAQIYNISDNVRTFYLRNVEELIAVKPDPDIELQ